jgi:hypothetical protein
MITDMELRRISPSFFRPSSPILAPAPLLCSPLITRLYFLISMVRMFRKTKLLNANHK